MSILESAIKDISGNEISGEVAFKLYDTYGFPVDLTADVARERGLKIDMKGFDSEMSIQKDRARKAGDFESKKSSVLIENPTEFLGYDHFDNEATITAIIKNNESINELSEGQEAIVVLDQSSFYGESGGQIGDQGTLSNLSLIHI